MAITNYRSGIHAGWTVRTPSSHTCTGKGKQDTPRKRWTHYAADMGAALQDNSGGLVEYQPCGMAWRHSPYLGSPDCEWRVRVVRCGVIINTTHFVSVHQSAKGETQLPAHDLSVQCELGSTPGKRACADASPDALPEELHAAKVDIVAHCRGHSGAGQRHKAQIPLCWRSSWRLTPCTSLMLPQRWACCDGLLRTEDVRGACHVRSPFPNEQVSTCIYIAPVATSFELPSRSRAQ